MPSDLMLRGQPAPLGAWAAFMDGIAIGFVRGGPAFALRLIQLHHIKRIND